MRHRATAAAMGVCIALATACGSDSRPDAAGFDAADAGFDAGFDECAEPNAAAISALLSQVCSDGGPAPAVVFRLRNASNADLWVATSRTIGNQCQPSTFLSTCSGRSLDSNPVRGELCPDSTARLEPDASIELPPYGLDAYVQVDSCLARSVRLPVGSYNMQFSYSLDAGRPELHTRALPFNTPTDGGVVELLLP